MHAIYSTTLLASLQVTLRAENILFVSLEKKESQTG
jgi:hypothetical protein